MHVERYINVHDRKSEYKQNNEYTLTIIDISSNTYLSRILWFNDYKYTISVSDLLRVLYRADVELLYASEIDLTRKLKLNGINIFHLIEFWMASFCQFMICLTDVRDDYEM